MQLCGQKTQAHRKQQFESESIFTITTTNNPTVNLKEIFRPVLDRKRGWRCTYPSLGLHIQQIHTALPDNQVLASDTESQEPYQVHSLAVFWTCLLHRNLLECQQTSSIHKQVDKQCDQVNESSHQQHCNNNDNYDSVYSMSISDTRTKSHGCCSPSLQYHTLQWEKCNMLKK